LAISPPAALAGRQYVRGPLRCKRAADETALPRTVEALPLEVRYGDCRGPGESTAGRTLRCGRTRGVARSHLRCALVRTTPYRIEGNALASESGWQWAVLDRSPLDVPHGPRTNARVRSSIRRSRRTPRQSVWADRRRALPAHGSNDVDRTGARVHRGVGRIGCTVGRWLGALRRSTGIFTVVAPGYARFDRGVRRPGVPETNHRTSKPTARDVRSRHRPRARGGTACRLDRRLPRRLSGPAVQAHPKRRRRSDLRGDAGVGCLLRPRRVR
jgi:hypothetical protein